VFAIKAPKTAPMPAMDGVAIRSRETVRPADVRRTLLAEVDAGGGSTTMTVVLRALGFAVAWLCLTFTALAADLTPLTAVTAKGEHVFQVEVADTNETRAKGLMFRTEMPKDVGMLFDFKSEQPVYFWMKNTYLPLDMIFIRANGTVARVEANTVPLSERTVPSGSPVRYVLELNAGRAGEIGLKPGDRVRHAIIAAP
jgi:hypothetical protein